MSMPAWAELVSRSLRDADPVGKRGTDRGLSGTCNRLHVRSPSALARKLRRQGNMGMADFTAAPLTPETWQDFEQVMGSNGGARGCWCMHWRVSFKEWEAGRGD